MKRLKRRFRKEYTINCAHVTISFWWNEFLFPISNSVIKSICYGDENAIIHLSQYNGYWGLLIVSWSFRSPKLRACITAYSKQIYKHTNQLRNHTSWSLNDWKILANDISIFPRLLSHDMYECIQSSIQLHLFFAVKFICRF